MFALSCNTGSIGGGLVMLPSLCKYFIGGILRLQMKSRVIPIFIGNQPWPEHYTRAMALARVVPMFPFELTS